MKKRLLKILCFVIILLVVFICTYKGKSLIHIKMDCNKIDKIQVIMPNGNTSKGMDSKIITDPSEIKQFVYIFNTANLVKKVPKKEEEMSSESIYKFYSGDELINTFGFNGCDSKRIYKDNDCYYVDYVQGEETPFELYKDSREHTILVDEEGNYISSGHEINIKNIYNDEEPNKIDDENSEKLLDIILDNWCDASEDNIFDCGYNYEISIDNKKYYFCLTCGSVVGDGGGIILNKDDFNTLREICGMYSDYKY